MEILPFRAPALSPLEAHVFNLLCTRAQPWPIDVAGTPCALEAGGLAAPVPPVCAFDVVCGERTWRVELGSLRLLALHPAVADVPPNAALPGALQLAVLDLLAAPLAELAQTFLHVPLAVRNVRMIEAAEPAVCALPLTLHVPVGAGASAEAYPIPVRLCLPDRESALELVERLDALPRRRALGLAGDVPVPVSLEAGRMRLSVNELSSLEPDDVLLPETYPAREGRVTLRLCATSRSLAFACSLAEGCATILSVLNPEEGPMSDENNTAAGAAPSEGVDTGELEVTLTFELERRLMTVRDVETLAPGYTFAFGGDALAPVTLYANGKSVGKGRLVDLNGTLGVQVVSLGKVGETGVNPLYFIVGMALLGLAPFFLMMVTSYVKIVVVTSLVRNALGVQQVPPAMVMNGLAIILSLFIMAPMMMSTMDIAGKLQISAEPSPKEVIGIVDKLSPPLRKFLSDNTEDGVLRAFMSTAKRIWPKEQHDQISKDNMLILVPAFTISELTKAFQVGFLLYLPFIAIDLIISNILLAMGMMMVSPMTISLPFKLLLFVTLDGWLKISQGLLLSYK